MVNCNADSIDQVLLDKIITENSLFQEFCIYIDISR